MKHWSVRLQEWCREKGWTRAELIRRSGVSRDLVYKYWDGGIDQPRGDILDRLAAPFGRSGAELRYGLSVQPSTSRIPLLEANEVGTMTPLHEIGDVWKGSRMTVVPEGLGDNTFSFQAVDDACAPKIESGDIVICTTDGDPEPGRFVLAKVDGVGVGLLRRYRPRSTRDNSQFTLVATNEDFPPIDVDKDHPGFVVGQVIKVIKDV